MDKPTDPSVTHVEILGRQYPIRSRLDSDDVTRLGAYVREKMEAVANRAPRRDLVHVAVLAALNIADDYFRSLDGRANDERHVLDRMLAIEAIVDPRTSPRILARGPLTPGRGLPRRGPRSAREPRGSLPPLPLRSKIATETEHGTCVGFLRFPAVRVMVWRLV